MQSPDYTPYTKKEWLELVAHSLKEAELSGFSWKADADLNGLVFAHPDDLNGNTPPPFNREQASNSWLIGGIFQDPEAFFQSDMRGFEVIRLRSLPADPGAFNKPWPENIREIQVGPFSGEQGNEWICTVQAAGASREIQLLPGLSVCMVLPAVSAFRPEWLKDEVASGMSYCVPVIEVNKPSESMAESLAHFFGSMSSLLTDLDEKERPGFCKALRIECSPGPDWLYGLAVIRAVKLLWNNLLAAWKIAPVPCRVIGRIGLDGKADDPNQQLILAVPAAVAAISGGVESLFLESGHPGYEGQSMTTLFRNLQWILREESGLGRVQDPAAGSYAIEDMTNQLAKKAWNLMVEKELHTRKQLKS